MLFQRFPNLPEWRQGVEELSHSWLTLLAWTREGLLLRNGIWTPPSPGVKYSRGGRKHPQLQIYGRKKRLHKTWGIWDTFQATRVTKEIVSSTMIFLCIFELSRGNCISTIYVACCPHPTEFTSAVLFLSQTHEQGQEENLASTLFFVLAFFFKSLLNFNRHLLHIENRHLKSDCQHKKYLDQQAYIENQITKAEKEVHRICRSNRTLSEDGSDF